MQGNIKERRKRVMKRSIFIVVAFVLVLSMVLTSCNVDELTLPEELVPSTEAPTDGMYDEEEPTEELNCEEQGDEEDSDDDSQGQDEDNDQGDQPRPTPTRTPMPTRPPTPVTPSPTPQNTPTRTPSPTPTPSVPGSLPFSSVYLGPFRTSMDSQQRIKVVTSYEQLQLMSFLDCDYLIVLRNIDSYRKRYNENFFNENALIVLVRSESSLAIRYEVTSLIRRDNELSVRFTRFFNPQRRPCNWYILVEVKQSDIAGVERVNYIMDRA